MNDILSFFFPDASSSAVSPFDNSQSCVAPSSHPFMNVCYQPASNGRMNSWMRWWDEMESQMKWHTTRTGEKKLNLWFMWRRRWWWLSQNSDCRTIKTTNRVILRWFGRHCINSIQLLVADRKCHRYYHHRTEGEPLQVDERRTEKAWPRMTFNTIALREWKSSWITMILFGTDIISLLKRSPLNDSFRSEDPLLEARLKFFYR